MFIYSYEERSLVIFKKGTRCYRLFSHMDYVSPYKKSFPLIFQEEACVGTQPYLFTWVMSAAALCNTGGVRVFAGEVAHPFRACSIYCLTLCRAIFLSFSVVRTHREAVGWLKPFWGFQILNFKPESTRVAVLSLFFTIIFKHFGKLTACILDL